MEFDLHTYKLNIPNITEIKSSSKVDVSSSISHIDKVLTELKKDNIIDGSTAIKKFLKLRKIYESVDKYSPLSFIAGLIDKNKVDIFEFYKLLISLDKEFINILKNKPLIFPAPEPDQVFVFQNIIITDYKNIGTEEISMFNIDKLIGPTKEQFEKDLNTQAKAKWTTDEAAYKTAIRNEKMLVGRALRRFILPEDYSDQRLKELVMKIEKERSIPELIWCEKPEDYAVMYDETGPSSCMRQKSDNHEFLQFSTLGIHITSFYAFTGVSKGVYIRQNGKTLARAIAWKFPKWDNWVIYRFYSVDGNKVMHFFKDLFKSHNIEYYNDTTEHSCTSITDYTKFTIPWYGGGIIPYPYMDGCPAGMAKYIKLADNGDLEFIMCSGKYVETHKNEFKNYVPLQAVSNTITKQALIKQNCHVCGVLVRNGIIHVAGNKLYCGAEHVYADNLSLYWTAPTIAEAVTEPPENAVEGITPHGKKIYFASPQIRTYKEYFPALDADTIKNGRLLEDEEFVNKLPHYQFGTKGEYFLYTAQNRFMCRHTFMEKLYEIKSGSLLGVDSSYRIRPHVLDMYSPKIGLPINIKLQRNAATNLWDGGELELEAA